MKFNKRPTGLYSHLSIRDSSLTSCLKGSYLHINNPIIELINNNNGIGKQHYNPLINTIAINVLYIDRVDDAFSLYY